MTKTVASNSLSLDDFRNQVDQFAQETDQLLQAVFDDQLPVEVDHREGLPRSVIKSEVRLFARDAQARAKEVGHLASLTIQSWFCLDSSRTHLAVKESKFALVAALDRTPIIRFEYDRERTGKPGAHIQIHGHRGALSHLLTMTGHPSPHSMESLHLPTGGDRFRVSLEDVVEFLVTECRFRSRPNWHQAVVNGRARWRRLQLVSAVRDMPQAAAEELRRLGYQVTEPESGPALDDVDKLNHW